MSRQPTLSVVMPNYNHAAYLPAAVRSIVQQTRPPDEFLVLDDASTDNSVEVIESLAAQFPLIRFIRNEQNQGVIGAHRRLFEMATGDFICGAAADDERYPDFFARAMEMAAQFPQTGLVFGDMVITNAGGREIGRVTARRWPTARYVTPQEYLREYLEVETPLHSATAATILRRTAFAEVGWYRAELSSFTDTFAARAVALKYGACYLPEPFCKWRKLAHSASQTTTRDARRTLEVAAKTAQLMRSPEFRDRFPVAYVARWETRVRRQVLWNVFLGEDYGNTSRPSFLWRNLLRLQRLPQIAQLYFSV